MMRKTLFAGALLAAAAAALAPAGGARALTLPADAAATAIPDRAVAIYDDGQANGDQALGFVISFVGDDLSVSADIYGGEAPGGTSGLGPVESLAIDILLDGSGGLDPTSQLAVFGPDGPLLTATGADILFETDRVRALFSVDGGALAGRFGPLALMTLSGFGLDASGGPAAFMGDAADVEINPAALAAAVPLPGALPMLAAGLAALGAARLRRARG